MPRAKKRARELEPVDETVQIVEVEEPEQEGGRPLEFDEALTWRPGKQIPVADLLRRLRALAEELESMPQEDADRATLVPKAQELVSEQLIGHRDRGVKAFTMLCIVEMFRLLAPDAPYKSRQLKEIFSVFTSTIVSALGNQSDPYNEQHMAVLASLATVKSIVLATDIPGSDNLIRNLFTNCFDVLSGVGNVGLGEKLPKNLENHITNALCTLVDECVELPTGVVDIILAQFWRTDSATIATTTKKGGTGTSLEAPLELPPAYNAARAICNTCSEKMAREIGNYFSAVLIDVSETRDTGRPDLPRRKKRTYDESENGSDDGLLTPPAGEDLREIEKAHRLLRELWRSSPDVIRSVVPQIEVEADIDDTHLRVMAVQTLGDMIAGIGAAGQAPPVVLNPAAYPAQSLEEYEAPATHYSPLLAPDAPYAFSSVYASAYQRFVDRHKDKTFQVRGAWATAAARVLFTSAGGKGLDGDQENTLLGYMAGLLVDTDERVRLATIQAIAQFDFNTLIEKLGKSGSAAVPGSILSNLTDRIKDRKPQVRTAAMELLGQIWGVAAGAIAEGRERTRELFGSIPSKIFDAWYVNDPEIHALIQRVLWESLLPITYPPIKAKRTEVIKSQRAETGGKAHSEAQDPDAIRAERILVFVRDLEEKSKLVFFALQQKREQIAKFVGLYLEHADAVYSSADDQREREPGDKKKLDTLIQTLAKSSANPSIATEHLKKFAKHHDRRCFQLIRFCFNPEMTYRKVFNAMKELSGLMEKAPSGMAVTLETIVPLLRSAAILVYNRSHVPAIVEASRTDRKGLGTAAHEVLKEISTKAPAVFKVHVLELCEELKKQSPASGIIPDRAVVDTLKACAAFSRRFPDGMPKDREFYSAMVAFAVSGTPPKAAKHAITVIATSADKREMYINAVQDQCIEGFEYGKDNFVSKIAAISQLRLLANRQCEDKIDAILAIAVEQILLQDKSLPHSTDPAWQDIVDEDLSAKLWALRILVNGLRGLAREVDADSREQELKVESSRVYKLLNTLVVKEGELAATDKTPRHHKAHLRLAAAKQLLKLSGNRKFDRLFSQQDFIQLSLIVQDPVPEVRAGFVKALKKGLGSGVLPSRYYSLVFLTAFEPNKDTMQATFTWLKSRAAVSAKTKDQAMEGAFARFLSLLAHHQDFSSDTDDLKDFVEYIMFFLKSVASQENLPLLYHVAQRLKQVQDGIDAEKSENLYILSDLAESIIRQFQELHGWSLQLTSARVGLPVGLFQKLSSHETAQEIAEKRFIPDELVEELEDMVKASMKSKKRKSDGSSTQAAKKPKTLNATAKKPSALKSSRPVKTPKKTQVSQAALSADRRKSARASDAKNYTEQDDSDDDEEMEQWQIDHDDDGDEANAGAESSTPPTSDPTPAPEKEVLEVVVKEPPLKKAPPPKPLRTQAPNVRRTRATRTRKEKDIMDIPSDDD